MSPFQDLSHIACVAELTKAEVLAIDFTESTATSAKTATDLATSGRDSLILTMRVLEERRRSYRLTQTSKFLFTHVEANAGPKLYVTITQLISLSDL